MRLLKRLLLFAMEAVVLVFGIAFTVAIAAYLNSTYVFVTGLAVTVSCLLVIRRKTRKFKIDYDTARWLANRLARQLHPGRPKRIRLLRHCGLWLPSACAAMVLRFFPVASHFVHPRAHCLKHYRAPIPWTFTVFSSMGPPEEYSFVNALASSSGVGRFGVTPFWDSEYVPFLMTFGSIASAADLEFNYKLRELRRNGAPQESEKDFLLGGVALNCWQYSPPQRRGLRLWLGHSYDNRPLWEISCETPVDAHVRDFYASFYGRLEDILSFYSVLQHVGSTD
jgi:hypothetical protein